MPFGDPTHGHHGHRNELTVAEAILLVGQAWAKELHHIGESISNQGSRDLATKQDITQAVKTIMASQASLAADLRLVLAQQIKTIAEIQALQAASDVLADKITELEAVIAAGSTEASQELADAVAAVRAQAQLVDDAIPDAPTAPGVPAILPPLTATGAVGAAFSHQLVANPAATSFSASPLPEGLSLGLSGLIEGVPTTAGETEVSVSGTNAAGTGAAEILTVTIT